MKHQRIILLCLMVFIFLTVVPSALFMLVRPNAGLYNFSLHVLSYSIFKRYFLLYIFLSIALTGMSLVTFLCVLRKTMNAAICYLNMSIGLLVWIIAGVMLAGQINWLHLVYFAAGMFIMLRGNITLHHKLPHFKH